MAAVSISSGMSGVPAARGSRAAAAGAGAALLLLLLLLLLLPLLAGCGPSEECRRYVACQTKFDPTVDTTPYDEGGSCWATLQTSQACTAQCLEALDALAKVPGAPAECSG